MIKINLLDSVTDRQPGAVRTVEKKVSSPASRLLFMGLAAGALLLAVVGWLVVSTQMEKAKAEKELENQKQIAAQLESVMNEQKDLEAKINNINTRIEAIKKLRSTQAGPSAVLEALKERIGMVDGLFLESVEQRGDQLTIKGSSPDESVVTQFGRSLEFSSGLFSNLNIETARKEAPVTQTSAPAKPDAPKPEIVNFTIRCAYTPSKANAPDAQTAAANNPNEPGKPGAPPANGQQPPAKASPAPQVAKN